MSRHEIVEGYLDGQLSRRVFIRRLVATGVTAAAAISYAGLLDADPVAAQTFDYYLAILDNQFDGSPVRLEQGQGFYFSNVGSSGHNARDITGLGLFFVPPMGHYQQSGVITPPGAGSYTFKCDETDHPRMVGAVQVPLTVDPPTAPLGSTFNVRWAHATPPTGFVFDVQRIKAGQRNFTAWRTGVRYYSANFHPAARGLYTFRARVRKVSNNRTSGWSPVKRIRVT